MGHVYCWQFAASVQFLYIVTWILEDSCGSVYQHPSLQHSTRLQNAATIFGGVNFHQSWNICQSQYICKKPFLTPVCGISNYKTCWYIDLTNSYCRFFYQTPSFNGVVFNLCSKTAYGGTILLCFAILPLEKNTTSDVNNSMLCPAWSFIQVSIVYRSRTSDCYSKSFIK